MPRKKAATTPTPIRTDETNFWMGRVADARRERDRVSQEWDVVRNALLGRDIISRLDGYGLEVGVNLAHAYLQTLIPKLVLQNPKMTGIAKRKGSEQAAKLMAAVDNYYLDELEMVPEFREGVANAGSFAIGVMKVGYIPYDKDYPELPDDDDSGRTEIDRAEEEIDALAGSDVSSADEARPEPDPAALIDPLKKRGSFFAEEVDPRDFLWDPKARKFRGCRWMGNEYVMPVEAIRKEKRFDESVRSKVTGTLRDADQRERPSRGGPVVNSPVGRKADVAIAAGGGRAGKDAELGYDRLIEIWDWEGQMLYTFAESAHAPLQKVKWPYPTEGPPYAILRFNITPGEIIPVSDISAAMPQVREVNYVRQHRAKHLRNFNRKYSVDPSVYEDEESIQALEEGDDGTLVKGPPGTVAPIADATVSPDYDRHEQAIKTDFREITAQNEMERGSAQGIDTATVGAILDANAKIRSNYLRGLTEEWIGKTFKLLNQLIRAWLPASVAVQITGDPEAEGGWVEVQKDDLQGEYAVRVVAGSTVPGSEMMRRQELKELKSILTPDIQTGLVNPVPLLRQLLEAYGINNIEEFLNIQMSAPDSTAPMAQPDLLAALMTSGASGQANGGGAKNPADAVSAAFGRQAGYLGGLS